MLSLLVREPFHMPVTNGEMMEPNTLLTDDEATVVREHPHLLMRCVQLSPAAVANIEATAGKRETQPAVVFYLAAKNPMAAMQAEANAAAVKPPVIASPAPISTPVNSIATAETVKA
jgi:hypothetical protein